jgi:hypothetical protein
VATRWSGPAAQLFRLPGCFSGGIGAGLDRLAGTVFVGLGARMIASR